MLTEVFKNDVNNNDVLGVRIMLKDSLLIDPTFVSFNEEEKYASSKMNNLYDKHNGEKLNFDKTAWNRDYLDMQMIILVENFSHERIELLKAMIQVLYKEKADKIRAERDKAKHSSIHIGKKEVGVTATITGGAVAIAGCIATQVPIIIAGTVIAAVGVGLIATDDKNKKEQ